MRRVEEERAPRRLVIAAGVLAIAAVAAWLRLRGLAFGLPAVYNPDELAIMSRALAFAKGDLNPHNFLYPTLYFYALFAWVGLYFAAAYAAGVYQSVAAFQQSFFTDPTNIYLAGRALGVACGVLTVFATWRLGERVADRAAGLAGAWFLAVAPFAVRDAHYVKHDVPAALAATLAILAVLAADARGSASTLRRRNLVVAGLACGLAASVHYYLVFLALPLLASSWSVQPGGRVIDRLRRVAITSAAAAAGFFAGTPFLLAEPLTAWQDIVANRRIVMDRAVAESGMLFPSVGEYARMLWHDALGWPTALLAILGVAVIVRRDGRTALLLLSFPVVFLLFISNTVAATRYLNPVLPFVAVLAGVAVSAGLGRLKAAKWRPLVAVAAVLVAGAPGAMASIRMGAFLAATDTRTLAQTFIQATVPAGSTVLIQPYSVPLAPTRESLRAALSRRFVDDRDLPVKFRLQLTAEPYHAPAYRLLWMGSGGLDADKVYVPYERLVGKAGLEELQLLGVDVVVLKSGRALTSEARDLRALLEAHGSRLASFTPYADGVDAAAADEPFLHNTDAEIGPTLVRPGPPIEVWTLPRTSVP